MVRLVRKATACAVAVALGLVVVPAAHAEQSPDVKAAFRSAVTASIAAVQDGFVADASILASRASDGATYGVDGDVVGELGFGATSGAPSLSYWWVGEAGDARFVLSVEGSKVGGAASAFDVVDRAGVNANQVDEVLGETGVAPDALVPVNTLGGVELVAGQVVALAVPGVVALELSTQATDWEYMEAQADGESAGVFTFRTAPSLARSGGPFAAYVSGSESVSVVVTNGLITEVAWGDSVTKLVQVGSEVVAPDFAALVVDRSPAARKLVKTAVAYGNVRDVVYSTARAVQRDASALAVERGAFTAKAAAKVLREVVASTMKTKDVKVTWRGSRVLFGSKKTPGAPVFPRICASVSMVKGGVGPYEAELRTC